MNGGRTSVIEKWSALQSRLIRDKIDMIFIHLEKTTVVIY